MTLDSVFGRTLNLALSIYLSMTLNRYTIIAHVCICLLRVQFTPFTTKHGRWQISKIKNRKMSELRRHTVEKYASSMTLTFDL